ncbi:MAG TPA: hypothetical protein VEA60_14970, partial [Allosphingosinicella sp.]|nr:hypothetical protein [Allosphingosinicella sp.]
MSEDIAIRHCRIEARARSGSGLAWADEAAQRAFGARVQALVLAMLDELLAPYLARLEPGAVPSALVLDLRLDPSDLAGAAPLARTHLRARMTEAIAAALASAPSRAERPPRAPPVRPTAVAAASAPVRPRLELLLAWHGDRQLGYRLALLSRAALAALVEGVLAELAARPGAGAGARRGAAAISDADAALPAGGRPGRHALREILRSLVEAAAEALAPDAGRPKQALLARAAARARRAVRNGRAAAEQRRRTESGEERGATADRAAADPAVEHPPRPASGRSERAAPPRSRPKPTVVAGESRSCAPAPLADGLYEIESVLPFLALQPLARHGILAAIAAIGADSAEAVAALAFATALRTLDPPAAAGRWSKSQQASAARCSGRDEPFEGAALLAAARSAGEVGDLAAGVVAAALIAGHRPGLPLPLVRDDDCPVVFESEGLYPLGRLDAARIAEAFAESGEIFFVADPKPDLLREIDAAGLGAVASGTPVRGESWTALAVRGWRGMTNLPPARAAAFGPRLPEAERSAIRASEVWRALTAERPLLPDGAGGPAFAAFDRASALLAGFALADLAWTLFRRDPAAWAEPDPLLAVERFGDLTGTLRLTADEAVITLPLGARFADLR